MYGYKLRMEEEDLTMFDIAYLIDNAGKTIGNRTESINHLNEEAYPDKA